MKSLPDTSLSIPRLPEKHFEFPARAKLVAKVALPETHHDSRSASRDRVSSACRSRESFSAMLFACNSRISSYCSEFLQSSVNFGNFFDSSISLRNLVVSSASAFVSAWIFLKLRQVAASNEPIFVDVDSLFSVILATNIILDFAIFVCHGRWHHKLNFEMNTPIADSAVGPRRNVPVCCLNRLFFGVLLQLPECRDFSCSICSSA